MMQVVTNSSQGNYQTCIAVKWEKIPTSTSFYDLQEEGEMNVRGFALDDDPKYFCGHKLIDFICIMHLEFGLLWILKLCLFFVVER